MIVQLYCSVHETRPLLPTPHMERRVPASSVEGQSTTTTTRLVSMSSQTTATQHIFVSWFIKWKFVVFLFCCFFFCHWQRPIWQRNIFSGLLLPPWAAILTKFCVGEKNAFLIPTDQLRSWKIDACLPFSNSAGQTTERRVARLTQQCLGTRHILPAPPKYM